MKPTPQSRDDARLGLLRTQLQEECSGTIPALVIHPSASDLYDAVTDELPARDMADVKNHILVCETCKRSSDALLVSLIDDGVWRDLGLAHLAVYGEEAPRAGKPFVWRPAADQRTMTTLLRRWFAKDLSRLAMRDGADAVVERVIAKLALASDTPGVFDEALARQVVDRYLDDERVRVRATPFLLLSGEEQAAFRRQGGDPFLRTLAAGRVLRSWAASPDERARARAVCGRPPPGRDIESIRAGCDRRVAAMEREMGARIASAADRSPTQDDGAKSWRLIAWRDDLESVVVALAHMRSRLPPGAPKGVEQMIRIAEHRLLSDLRAFDQALGSHLVAIKTQMRSAFSTAAHARVANQVSDRLAAVSVHGEDGICFQLVLDVREVTARQRLVQVAKPAADEIVVDLMEHPLALCEHTEGHVATVVSTFEHHGQEFRLKIASVARARTRQVLLVVEKGAQRLGGITVALGGRKVQQAVRGTPAVGFELSSAAAREFRLSSRSIGLDTVTRISGSKIGEEMTIETLHRFLEEMVGRPGLKVAATHILKPCVRCGSLGPEHRSNTRPNASSSQARVQRRRQ